MCALREVFKHILRLSLRLCSRLTLRLSPSPSCDCLFRSISILGGGVGMGKFKIHSNVVTMFKKTAKNVPLKF